MKNTIVSKMRRLSVALVLIPLLALAVIPFTLLAGSPVSLAKWTFNEGSGATANDSSGAHNAIVSGATWETNGFLASGLRFSSNTTVVVPGFELLDQLRTLQISFALLLDQVDTGGEMHIVSQFTTTSNTLPMASVFANDFLNSAVRRSVGFALYATNQNTSISGTAVPLTSNQWYQVVCRYDGTNMDVTVNGVLAGRYAAGPVAMPIRSTRNLILGGFTGVLDEVEISTLDPIPSVSLERANSYVMVRFTGTLEVGTNAAGPYQAVTQATNLYLAPISGPQRFWRTSLPGPTPSPNVAPMLQILPSYIQSALAENQALLPRNPGLSNQIQAKITMLQNPNLASEIINGQFYCEGGAISRDGSRIPIVCVFAQSPMRADVIESVRSLQLAIPIVENFLETDFPTARLWLWYGFKLGNTGGGGAIYSEDRASYESRTPVSRLPFESILHHELAHSYYGNESITQFLELYIYNLIHTQSTDVHSWITTRNWVAGASSNTGVHALLDIYDWIGPIAMANAYQVIYPLRPPYGQPLSPACRQAFVDQAPEPLKTQVAEKANKI